MSSPQIQTQSQRDLKQAAERVQQVQGESWKAIYGGLCHSFPVLVKTVGLAQAVAFHESKAEGDKSADRPCAHARLIEDACVLLGVPVEQASQGALSERVAKLSLSEYMRATRRILAAGSFYKRFAVSVLKAEAGKGDEDA